MRGLSGGVSVAAVLFTGIRRLSVEVCVELVGPETCGGVVGSALEILWRYCDNMTRLCMVRVCLRRIAGRGAAW